MTDLTELAQNLPPEFGQRYRLDGAFGCPAMDRGTLLARDETIWSVRFE